MFKKFIKILCLKNLFFLDIFFPLFMNNTLSLKKRSFSTSRSLLVKPTPNDQDTIYEEVNQVKQEWRNLNQDMKEVTKDIKEDEVDYQSGEEETELSKYVTKREAKKDRLIEEGEAKRETAFYDRGNAREDKAILLQYMNKATKKDIKTLEKVESDLSGLEPGYDRYTDVYARSKDQEAIMSDLIRRYHMNDLAPIRSTDANKEASTPQKSSILDDYADTSTEMPSYMDPED